MITHHELTPEAEPVTHEAKGLPVVEDRGSIQIMRAGRGTHSVFGIEIANRPAEMVDQVDRDPSVHAVAVTGARPGRRIPPDRQGAESVSCPAHEAVYA